MSGKRLFHSVAEKISALIDEGTYPPGTRLPGERELAERFNVSRVTIREAEIALQAVGKIEIKTGSGVYVAETPSGDAEALPAVSAFELTEARALFESEAAALAAVNIDEAALEKLDELIEAMGTPGDDDASNEADRLFHLTIAEASGNKAIVHTVQTLWRMRAEIPQVKSAYDSVCVDDAAYRRNEHLDVLKALKAGDPAAARQAMRRHFYRLIEAMLDATEARALQEVQERADRSRKRYLERVADI